MTNKIQHLFSIFFQ